MLTLEQLIGMLTLKNFIVYIIVVNMIGFLVMLIDKKKAKNGSWRIKEATIFSITFLGGGIGTIVGMYIFRHKTKKYKFTIGLPAILICEIILIIFIYLKGSLVI